MIGQRLKALRRERKVRQEDLATAIGVQKATVSHYETGKTDPSDKVKVEIARFFNVSLDYLLGVIDEAVPHYQPQVFIKLPQNIDDEDRALINRIVTFVDTMYYSMAKAN